MKLSRISSWLERFKGIQIAVEKLDKIIIKGQLPHFCGRRCVEAEGWGLSLVLAGDASPGFINLSLLSAAQQCQLLPIKRQDENIIEAHTCSRKLNGWI